MSELQFFHDLVCFFYVKTAAPWKKHPAFSETPSKTWDPTSCIQTQNGSGEPIWAPKNMCPKMIKRIFFINF